MVDISKNIVIRFDVKNDNNLIRTFKKVETASGNIDTSLNTLGKSSQKNFKKMSKAADQTNRSLVSMKKSTVNVYDQVKRLSTLLLTSFGTAKLLQYADAYNLITSRIKIAVETENELISVRDKLFKISQETFSSWEASTKLYQKIIKPLQKLGYQYDDTFKFIERVNKILFYSKTSAKEAKAGILQLSQALGSGRLQGDELRSILENLPELAQKIVEGSNLTSIADLRKQASAGLIDAKFMVDALENVDASINKLAKSSTPILSQSMTKLGNAFTQFIGESDKAIGITNFLSRALNAIAENIELIIGPAFLFLGTIAIQAVISSLKVLANFMKGGIIVKSLVAIGAAITGLGGAGAAAAVAGVTGLAYGTYKLGNYFWGANDAIKDTKGSINSLNKEMDKNLSTQWQMLNSVQNIIKKETEHKKSIDGVIASLKEQSRVASLTQMQKDYENIINDLKKVSPDIQITGDDKKGIMQGLKTLEYDTKRASVLAGIIGEQKEENVLRKIYNDLLNDGLITLKKYNDLTLKIKKPGISTTPTPSPAAKPSFVSPTFSKSFENLKKEYELQKLSNKEREVQYMLLGITNKLNRQLTNIESTKVRTLVESNIEAKEQANVLRLIKGRQEDLRLQLVRINKQYNNNKITLDEYNKALLMLKLQAVPTTLFQGFTHGMLRMGQEAEKFGTKVSEWVVKSVEKAGDAITKFVKTGKLNFHTFVTDIVAELFRLSIKSTLMGGLSSILGGNVAHAVPAAPAGGGIGLGNIGGIIMQGFNMLTGGIPGARNGGSFMVGGAGAPDSKLARLRVSPGERIDVLTRNQQNHSGNSNLNVKIVNNIDAKEALNTIDTYEGEKVIMNFIERNSSDISKVLGRA